MRRKGIALLGAIVLTALTACSGGSSDAKAGANADKSETTQPTGISADDPGCRYIVAGDDSRATIPGPTLQYLTTPVVQPSACYDKVSFTFSPDEESTVTTTTGGIDASTCSPAYTVEYREAPFGLLKADGKGVSTSTGGFKDAKAVLYVEMQPAIALSTFPSKPELAYPGGLRLVFEQSAMHHVVIVEWVKNLPEGESTSAPTTTIPGALALPQRVVWLIGLDKKRPFTTDCAPGPLPGATCALTTCTHINVLIMK